MEEKVQSRIESINMGGSAANEVKATRYGLRDLFRRSELSIGTRLSACFVAIVVLMIALDGVTVWQFRRMAAATEGLSNADQASLAVIRVHLDFDTFRDKVVELANSHDTQHLSSEAASLEQTFLRDVEHAERMLSASPEIEQDAAISGALGTLKVTLPSQLHTAVELASAGDWTAVRLRLEKQIKDLIGLSASLVERVGQQTMLERTQAVQNARQARQNLFIVGPIAGLLTLLTAAALGWYVTRTITVPLTELTAGAEALARGDFQHRLEIFGNDELAVLAKAFNYAARQLQELYEGLRRSETELRDLIENVPAMVFIALPGISNAFASRRWREYTGLSAEDTAGFGWQTVVHPEDLERHIEKWRVCSATGEPFEDEARFRRGADGGYRWFLVRAVPLRDRAGNILKWYGVTTDIEDRKRAEQALQRSEAYQAEAQRLTHTGSWAYDPVTGKINYWSEEIFRIHGLDPQRASAPDTEEFYRRVLHPEDRDRVQELLQKAFREKTDFEEEYRVVRPDGAVRHLHVIGHPVLEQTGALVEYVGTTMDVTERKRAESALSESEQRYRMLFEKANDAIFLENERDEIVEVNRRACELLGYSREELLTMKVSDLQAPEFRGQVGSIVRGEIEKHGSATFEAVDLHRSGRRIAVEVTNTPISDQGRMLMLSIVRDITERKRQEEELHQAQAAQFEISLETRVRERMRIARELHDTLLQSFQGLLLRFQSVLNMLPARPLEARQRLESTLDQAAEAITGARDTIQGLRSLVAETGDLAQAITAIGEELTSDASAPDPPAIDVEVEGTSRSLNAVVRDEAYRIAGEALRNAFRHAQARRITVEIRYERRQFRLRVRDDGKGIDEETARRAAAAGHFGLHGMRERAEIVGGRLAVRSRLDWGTEVELSIPGAIAYGESDRRSWLSRVSAGDGRGNGSKET